MRLSLLISIIQQLSVFCNLLIHSFKIGVLVLNLEANIAGATHDLTEIIDKILWFDLFYRLIR